MSQLSRAAAGNLTTFPGPATARRASAQTSNAPTIVEIGQEYDDMNTDNHRRLPGDLSNHVTAKALCSLAALVVCLALPQEATPCSPPWGRVVVEIAQTTDVPIEGVLVFVAETSQGYERPEATVEVRDADGDAVDGIIERHRTWRDRTPGGMCSRADSQYVFVWRSAAPLDPGATYTYSATGQHWDPAVVEGDFTTASAPFSAPAAGELDDVRFAARSYSEHGQTECETIDDCPSSQTLDVRLLPGIDVEISGAGGSPYVWYEVVADGPAGNDLYPAISFDHCGPPTATVVFERTGVEEYCVRLRTTNIVTGESVLSDAPRCVIGPAFDIDVEPDVQSRPHPDRETCAYTRSATDTGPDAPGGTDGSGGSAAADGGSTSDSGDEPGCAVVRRRSGALWGLLALVAVRRRKARRTCATS